MVIGSEVTMWDQLRSVAMQEQLPARPDLLPCATYPPRI